MVNKVKRGIRALPRNFNAHNRCVVRDCPNRAIVRVQFKAGRSIYDLCRTCYHRCHTEVVVLERTK
jgi:hypothetical protein